MRNRRAATVYHAADVHVKHAATVTVTDTPATGTAPGITTATLPGGTVGTAYSQALSAAGTTPITWSVDGGGLPGGLTLTGNTISGNPTTAGTFNFTVKAENAKGSDIKALSIVIADAPATPPPSGGTPSTPTPKPEETEEPEETPAPPVADGIPLQIEKVNAYTDEVFPDVAPDDWFAESVRFVYEYGLFNGTDNGFEPSAKMSRAMLITALARAAGIDTGGGENWYELAVEWAKENGVSDGTNLSGEITREQLVTMLWRFAGSPKADGAIGFGDAAEISDYASDAIAWAIANGIVNGKPGNVFDPQGSATRAEVAAVLQRFAAKA
ncbi:MAG: S-layer homology domain-containing protein [Oscillospiraceae bacterium]|jgi:hypothetical protein|nr:S-layer homology domain-containing protein [Oscillospiraceae bacterium]